MIERVISRLKAIDGVTVVRHYRAKEGTDWYIHFDVSGSGPLWRVLTAAEGANCLVSLYRQDGGFRYWIKVPEENRDTLLDFLERNQ